MSKDDMELIALLVICDHKLSGKDKQWFASHCAERVEYLCKHDKTWGENLSGNFANLFLRKYIHHWADAYIQDTVKYQAEHYTLEATTDGAL